MKKPMQKQTRGGQAILVVVVLIGGVFMVTTAISGLLMFYQLQQAADAGNSTIAIFAADAGLERSLHCYFYGGDVTGQACGYSATQFAVTGSNATFTTTVTVNTATSTIIHSEGRDAVGKSIRALETTVQVSPTR